MPTLEGVCRSMGYPQRIHAPAKQVTEQGVLAGHFAATKSRVSAATGTHTHRFGLALLVTGLASLWRLNSCGQDLRGQREVNANSMKR
ncbi:hypothetical protein V5F77_26015 [Xanthobacter sp. DSM 24535]|uniref:hypothetical protein n=1 Tax=Roseixanthobacter psychrophilus TaxID=3119917 RepID=UPI00372B9A46